MRFLSAWLAAPAPDAAVEIAPGRVAAATLTARSGGYVVAAHAIENLPAGAVVPSLTGHNIADHAVVSGAVRSVLGRLGARIERVALVIPDVAAKVSLVHFDKMPTRRDDLDQLVRWQLRKSAPFPIEEASVTYTPGAISAEGGGDCVVVLARRAVVEEYEKACAGTGAHAGLVDLATTCVLNLFLATGDAPTGDWLVVHMRPEYTSIAIMRGDAMIFFRNRPEGDDELLADLVHQTTMYYQDRLAGTGFSRVLIGGSTSTPGGVEAARRSLEERLETGVELIDPTSRVGLADRITAGPELMDVLAPLAGMLLRTRHEPVGA
jgi:Tfp pilus assembly PilM family ATPase